MGGFWKKVWKKVGEKIVKVAKQVAKYVWDQVKKAWVWITVTVFEDTVVEVFDWVMTWFPF